MPRSGWYALGRGDGWLRLKRETGQRVIPVLRMCSRSCPTCLTVPSEAIPLLPAHSFGLPRFCSADRSRQILKSGLLPALGIGSILPPALALGFARVNRRYGSDAKARPHVIEQANALAKRLCAPLIRLCQDAANKCRKLVYVHPWCPRRRVAPHVSFSVAVQSGGMVGENKEVIAPAVIIGQLFSIGETIEASEVAYAASSKPEASASSLVTPPRPGFDLRELCCDLALPLTCGIGRVLVFGSRTTFAGDAVRAAFHPARRGRHNSFRGFFRVRHFRKKLFGALVVASFR